MGTSLKGTVVIIHFLFSDLSAVKKRLLWEYKTKINRWQQYQRR
jgi:uncharacterized membrane protein YagU involved in acid resistance